MHLDHELFMYMLRPKSYRGPLLNEESSLQFVCNGNRFN